MEVNIYTQSGAVRAVVESADSSAANEDLMADTVLTLSFTHYEYVRLKVNDYVDFLGKRYWLLKNYRPIKKSSIEYQYDVKFYGIESKLKKALVLKMVDGDNSTGFSLNDSPAQHLQLFVDNMNRITGSNVWRIGQVVDSANVNIEYDCISCFDGLGKLAEATKTEWWVEGYTMNLCRCEHGDMLELGYGKGLLNVSKDSNDNAPFFTRLYPIGNTRNIDPKKYGSSRLHLPGGAQYVEQNIDLGVVEYSEEAAFKDIYPRRVGHVGVVRHEPRTIEGVEREIYYFTDPGLTFNPNDYEIGGLVKMVKFQSGELNGQDFEVNWHNDTKEFEIINQYPYENQQLPGGKLIPKTGNDYVLYNIRMPEEYYGLAEQELADAVAEYLKTYSIDTAVYKAPTDYIYFSEKEINLKLGRRVRLYSEYFDNGYQDSRVVSISRKLNNPTEMNIGCSMAVSSTKLSKMENNITEIQAAFKEQLNKDVLQVLKSWDSADPSEYNVFSARRSQREFLSKVSADTARKFIRFLEGIDINYFVQGEIGARIDASGNAEFQTAVIRELLRSTRFVDGMFGEGFQLWMDKLTGLSNLTIDKVTIRQSLVAMEMLIEKVRSVGGQFIVSAANGKIKEVTREGDTFKITFEQDNTFVEHDLMRCATLSGAKQRSYWVEVSKSDTKGIAVPVSEFGETVPEPGDECVLMGNTTNALRQNLISIAATEDGQPRVDVLDGVKTKNFVGCLRVRLGNLDGIKDDRFPLDNQPRGNGLYGDNVFLVGTFILTTGEDILTRFEIVEGKIQTAIESVRHDFIADKSYLNNPTFSYGMDSWDTENEAVFFTLGGKWLWINDAPLSNKTDYACVKEDKGRTTVFIHNKYILQKHENFKSLPEFKEINPDGLKKSEAIYLGFFYRCASAGHLTIEFVNVDKNGFEEFETFSYESDIDVSEDYLEFNQQGVWNGTGDFKLSFTGDIYIYMLVLSTDRVNSLVYKYRTLFEQSDKLIRIAAENFDKDGNPIERSQIVTKADMNLITSGLFEDNGSLVSEAGLVTKNDVAALFAIDSGGSLKSFVGASVEGVKIKAENITLEGTVTANENFKVHQDGSIETKNAKINGYIYSPFIDIRESDAILQGDSDWWNTVYLLNTQLSIDATFCTIILPVSEAYAGARVLIMDSHFIKTRTATPPTRIKTADGSKIVSGLFCAMNEKKPWAADYLTIDAGVVELILKKIAKWDYDNQTVIGYEYNWVLISNSCRDLFLDKDY